MDILDELKAMNLRLIFTISRPRKFKRCQWQPRD